MVVWSFLIFLYLFIFTGLILLGLYVGIFTLHLSSAGCLKFGVCGFQKKKKKVSVVKFKPLLVKVSTLPLF